MTRNLPSQPPAHLLTVSAEGPHSTQISPDRFLTSPRRSVVGLFRHYHRTRRKLQPARTVHAEPTAGLQSAPLTPGSVPGSNSCESLLDGVISDVGYRNAGGPTANAVGSRQSQTPARPYGWAQISFSSSQHQVSSSRHLSRQTHVQRVRPETPFKRQSRGKARARVAVRAGATGYSGVMVAATPCYLVAPQPVVTPS